MIAAPMKVGFCGFEKGCSITPKKARFDPWCTVQNAHNRLWRLRKVGHLADHKLKILLNVLNYSPSYLVLPLNESLSALRTSVFELQVQQIESGISVANVGA